jgi:hypothetical protein
MSLKAPNEDVRECYRRIEYCDRMAQTHGSEEARREFLELRQRWLMLARSYELCARVEAFVKKTNVH